MRVSLRCSNSGAHGEMLLMLCLSLLKCLVTGPHSDGMKLLARAIGQSLLVVNSLMLHFYQPMATTSSYFNFGLVFKFNV